MRRIRIGLSGSIGSDDGSEVGVAEQELVVTLVGLEVCALLAIRSEYYASIEHTEQLQANELPHLEYSPVAGCEG